MFTRNRWIPPVASEDLKTAYLNLVKSINEFFLGLEKKNALNLTEFTLDTGTTTPTPTAGAGAFTTVSCTVNYSVCGDRVLFNALVDITTNGTAAAYIKFALPYTPSVVTAISGQETQTTFAACAGYASTDGSCYVWKYDGTYPGANGYKVRVSGQYKK